MAEDITVDLNPMADAYGFIYGQAHRTGTFHNINVMPPLKYWQGQYKLDGYEPHETDWVLYVDGEEVARVHKRTDIKTEFTRVLLEG